MNKILLLLVIVMILGVGTLFFSVTGGHSSTAVAASSTDNPPPLTPQPLSEAEKDNYVNTVKSISAQYRDLQKKFKALQDEQAKTKESVPSDKKINETVAERVKDKTIQLQADFKQQLKDLRTRFDKELKKVRTRKTKELPKGLGFDTLPELAKSTNGTFNLRHTSPTPLIHSGWSTVLPMTTIEQDDKDNSLLTIDGRKMDDPVRKTSYEPSSSTKGSHKGSSTTAKDKAKSIPAYTIPRNATLFSNDTLTALLGVIPLKGSVLDPIRFKLITGAENMATNGLYVPGVKDIVWSGIAIGNREMSCVRGELYSVTFTFEDGTIRTISTRDNNGNTDNAKGSKILGYISDQQGSPCIRGKLITNAGQYLTDRMIAAGVAATANAYSTTQQSTVVANGAVQTFFSGDTGKYIGSQALGGSFNELVQYLRDREANAVDLVVVPSGQDVVLHVEDQIDIDYDPDGRRLNHGFKLPTVASTSKLD